MIDDALYPIRRVAGTGFWADGHLLVCAQYPPGRHVLNESAAAVLLCSDGDRDVRRIVERLAGGCRETPRALIESQVHHCLAELAAGRLIEFARFGYEAVPVVRVRFLGFRAGSRPSRDEILDSIGQSMLVLAMDDGAVDVSFEFGAASDDRTMECPVCEHVRILVTDDAGSAGLSGFDCVLSHRDTGERVPSSRDDGSSTKDDDIVSIHMDSTLADRFYDFLFPITGGEPDALSAVVEPRSAASDVDRESGDPPGNRRSRPAAGIQTEHHVFLAADHRQSPGMLALVNSIVANSASPERFRFHLLVDGDCSRLSRVLDHAFGGSLCYELIAFPDLPDHRRCLEFLQRNIRIEGVPSARLRLDSVMNFARLYLPDMFPRIDVGLYLDVDMIVQGDLADLFDVDVAPVLLAAVASHSMEHYHSGLNLRGEGFNGGVLLINFERWRNCGVTEVLERIMAFHRRRRLFRGGTEPLLNVACRRQWRQADPLWNVSGLGFRDDIGEDMLTRGRILHWSGSRKPWLEDGFYRHRWLPYRIPEDHGTEVPVQPGS